MQTERGFFVHPFTCAWHRFSAERADFAVSDIVPGGQPELVLRVFNRIGYKSDASEIDDDEGTSATISPSWASASACGSLQESDLRNHRAVPTLCLRKKDDCEEPPDRVNWSWQLAPLFGPDRKLELKPTGKIPLHGDRALPGLHILRFSLVVRSFCLLHHFGWRSVRAARSRRFRAFHVVQDSLWGVCDDF